MFKSILPSKRVPSGEFTMLTPPVPGDGTSTGGVLTPNPIHSNGNGVYGKENYFDSAIATASPHGSPTKKKSGVAVRKSVPVAAQSGGDASPPYNNINLVNETEMNVAFDKLLDDLQIPKSLRPKLTNMDATVKAAMLKSSQIPLFQVPPPSTAPASATASHFAYPPAGTGGPGPTSPPQTPSRSLRRARSSDSIPSPRGAGVDANAANTIYQQQQQLQQTPQTAAPTASGFFHPSSHARHATAGSGGAPSSSGGSVLGSPAYHARGKSSVTLASFATGDFITGKGYGKGSGIAGSGGGAKGLSPARFISLLNGSSSTQLELESVKKLRMMLRNESASWTEEFIKLGGYAALLTRLNEILEVEWREEQHDDQILYEFLRCFKALSTSVAGCYALRSSAPTPFMQLITLLYSDKKPGDVATRHLVVEMLLILFDLYPPSAQPAPSGSLSRRRRQQDAWGGAAAASSSTLTQSNNNNLDEYAEIITLPPPHRSLLGLLRALMLTPAPPPAEEPLTAPVEPHEFIENLHRPRVYKTHLQELSDVCRDYFWVFCHPNNAIWNLAEVDEARVEKPRAPGGMTGGVEFEAMGYLTIHFKFLNAVADLAEEANLPPEDEQSAFRFHSDMILSGIERILAIARKASATYYPNLHLEISRFVAYAGRSGAELPWTVSRLIGSPPSTMCKAASSMSSPSSSAIRGHASTPSTGSARTGATTPRTPTRSGAPALPSPRKIDPLNF